MVLLLPDSQYERTVRGDNTFRATGGVCRETVLQIPDPFHIRDGWKEMFVLIKNGSVKTL